MLSRITWMGFYLGMGLSVGVAIGGILLASTQLVNLKDSRQSWKGAPLNTIAWFGVAPTITQSATAPSTVVTLQAPSFKLFGTSIFPSGHWALLGGEQGADASAKWFTEGERHGAYRLSRINARSVVLRAAEGEGEWTLSLNADPGTGAMPSSSANDCTGSIKVPRMAMDVLNQQQAMLLQGVETISGGKGVRVKPELAALLGGLGFMAGDIITSADGEILGEPHALISRVVNPLIQGRSILIKGKRGTLERQWQVISETACRAS